MGESLQAAPIRVLVAEDHGIVRAGGRLILEREPGFAVVGRRGAGRRRCASSGGFATTPASTWW